MSHVHLSASEKFSHIYCIVCEAPPVSNYSSAPFRSIFQVSEPSEHFNGLDSHTAAHTQSASRSSSHSKATHSHTYRNPSTSSSTTRQPQAHDQTQPSTHVQAQSSDGGIPPALASTLEHIIGQLDILTQVSGIC